jgi:hypothetical protein
MADQIFDGNYPKKDTPVLTDRVWGWDSEGNLSRGFELKDIVAASGVPTTRIIFTDLIITSPTAGTMTASWVNNEGIGNYLFEAPLTFIGAPAAGFFRFDNVLGNDNGTITVQTGTAAVSNPVIPTAPSTSIILATILWNEAGEAQVTQPGGPSAFPETRFTTRLEPGTNDKYAKIWEGNRSRENNYQIHISYGAPSSSQDWSLERPGKSGLLIVNFLCDNNRDILANNVQLETVDGNSEPGDFVLVQLTGNKVALFHKSTDFWMRLQFRVVFNSTATNNNGFLNNSQYLALPSGTNWQSVKYTGAGSLVFVQSVTGLNVDITDPLNPIIEYPEGVVLTSNTVVFNNDNVSGITTARTGDVLVDLTNAKVYGTFTMIHNDASAFGFFETDGTTPFVFYQSNTADYVAGQDNILDFQFIGDGKVRLTISQPD